MLYKICERQLKADKLQTLVLKSYQLQFIPLFTSITDLEELLHFVSLTFARWETQIIPGLIE